MLRKYLLIEDKITISIESQTHIIHWHFYRKKMYELLYNKLKNNHV